MKKLYLLILFILPLFSLAQIQVGNTLTGVANSDFGTSVSLSSDGRILAVGSNIENSNAGAVRIYQNQSGVWTQIGNTLTGVSSAFFGNSVSLSSDGSTIAVGAYKENLNAGTVRIYQNQSGVWTQIGSTLTGVANSDFGTSVSLSSDGSILAVGAYVENSNSGAVRIYQNQSGVWTQIGSTLGGESGAYFGISVSLSSDGSILAIGAYKENLNAGTVRIYQNQSGVWTQIGSTLTGVSSAFFGNSVSLSSDGRTVAVGVYGENLASGAVRIYQNQSGVWTQIGSTLTGADVSFAYFGTSVSLSSDGTEIAVGSLGENSYSGTARIYQNVNGVWSQIGSTLTGESSATFGYSLSLSSDGKTVAIGAVGENSNTGAVRVYDISSVILGLADPIVNANFRIYPNPVKDYFTVKLNNTYNLQNVSMYNILGQQVLEQKTNTINTSNLSKGLYFVKVETNKGTGVKKVIIQ